MSDSEPVQGGFIGKVENELREDAAADTRLAEELLTELVDKVHALERRVAKLERGK